MTIRGFWRDVRDRLRQDRPHPDDRWTEVANEAVFGRRDARRLATRPRLLRAR